MIYTIGDREKYEPLFAEPPVLKQGKDRDYGGGSVWQSYAHALAYLIVRNRTHQAIYGVLADWEADTEQVPGEPYRRLTRTAEMVKVEPPAELLRLIERILSR